MLAMVAFQALLWSSLVLTGLLIEALALRGGGANRRIANAAFGGIAFGTSAAAAFVIGKLALPGPLVDATATTSTSARALLAVLWIGLYDLGYYAWHRLQHASPTLWRIHRIHHGDAAFDVTTYMRQHWLEGPAQSVFIGVPLGLALRIPDDAALLAIAAMTAIEFYSHLDVPWSLGPLTRIVTGPELHRTHHASDRSWSNANFAAVLPLWDIAFGTWRSPTSSRVEDGKAAAAQRMKR